MSKAKFIICPECGAINSNKEFNKWEEVYLKELRFSIVDFNENGEELPEEEIDTFVVKHVGCMHSCGKFFDNSCISEFGIVIENGNPTYIGNYWREHGSDKIVSKIIAELV